METKVGEENKTEDKDKGETKNEDEKKDSDDEGADDPATDLLAYAASEAGASYLSRFLHDFAVWEFNADAGELLAAVAAATSGERRVNSALLKFTKSYEELMFGDDLEFEETFRLARKTVKWIWNELKMKRGTQAVGGKSLDSAVLLLLWYIGHAGRTLDEASAVFSIEDTSQTRAIMLETCNIILEFLADSALKKLPTPQEEDDMEASFTFRCKFPTVVGILGCYVFGMDKNERVTVQVLVDHRGLFRQVFTVVGSADSLGPNKATEWAEHVLAQSPIAFIAKEARTDGRHILAGGVYTERGCIVTPFPTKNLNSDGHWFNTHHTKVMCCMTQAMAALVTRFPKLGCLGLRAAEIAAIVKAASVLHNISVLQHDLAMVGPPCPR